METKFLVAEKNVYIYEGVPMNVPLVVIPGEGWMCNPIFPTPGIKSGKNVLLVFKVGAVVK